MQAKSVSRRSLLRGIGALPAVSALLGMAGCGKEESLVCADPSQLTMDEASLRASLHYTERSPDTRKTCSGCGFFAQSTPPGCGQCQMLKGRVNATGHCDSWSART